MKPNLLICCLLFLLVSCSFKKADLHVSDYVVSPPLDSTFVQASGTRVFFHPPIGYKQQGNLPKYLKDDHSGMLIMENRMVAFDQAAMVKRLEDMHNKGLNRLSTDYYLKQFTFNGYDALLVTDKDTTPGQNQLVMGFGSKDFMVFVTGVYRKGDTLARNALLHSYFSMRVDEKANPINDSLSPFAMDLTGTDFRLAIALGNSFIYMARNEDGSPNNGNNEIIVTPADGVSSHEALREVAKNFLDGIKDKGIDIRKVVTKEINIHGQDAILCTFSLLLEGKEGSGYEVVMGNDQQTGVFLGTAINEVASSQIELIAHRLRLK